MEITLLTVAYARQQTALLTVRVSGTFYFASSSLTCGFSNHEERQKGNTS